MRVLILSLLSLLPGLAMAETWRCRGEAPDWTLWFDAAQAEFTFPAPTQMDVVQQNAAENRDWPRALTLIGARDTAILLVEPLACTVQGATQPFRILVLTQRAESPILLAGCCVGPE